MSHFTFIDIPDDEFDVPATRWERRRRIRRWVALVTSAVLAATLVAWGGTQLVTHRCRWLDFSLAKAGGECVGVTNEKAFLFDGANHDAAYADVLDKIATENRWVRAQWEQARHPYVRVALMMPMSSTAGSPFTPGQVLHSLQGAYTALYRANHTTDVRDPTPLVQLLLANEGSSQAQWRRVVAALVPMAGQEHPLVAVVGLGVSIPETAQAAGELGKKDIPTVGAVLSSNDIVADRLFRISPSNRDYATAIQHYLDDQSKLRPEQLRGFLLWDTNKDDNYVRDLRNAFEQQLSGYIQNRRASYVGQLKRSKSETAVLFARPVDEICQAQPDVIFFAGRVRDLIPFILSLADRSCGTDRRLTILTGATGLSAVEENQDVIPALKSGKIDLLHAASADASHWVQGVGRPPGFAGFLNMFRNRGFTDRSLRDGYAIMHHDAVLMAIWATRLVTEQGGAARPADTFRSMQDLKAVPGASGTLSFDDKPGGWPKGKPVPVVRIPADQSDLITPVYIAREG